MCYSPKIKEEFVRRLYLLKQKSKKPMTTMVNEAVEKYLEKEENEKSRKIDTKNIDSCTKCT